MNYHSASTDYETKYPGQYEPHQYQSVPVQQAKKIGGTIGVVDNGLHYETLDHSKVLQKNSL